ncbi:MAG: sulfite oxidase [Acidobacteriota bacterium]|nr:sulfite oxidase [Acidobacteriota bacterium]
MGADGLISREQDPENLESPPSAFDSYLTPNELFYVRNHFATPHLQVSEWRLRVQGSVERPREFTYEELVSMPSRNLVATLECAGNSRTFLPEKSKGVQWHLGAVGNAEWTGVPLSLVLAEAGLQNQACEIVLEGADQGRVDEDPKTPGAIHYARSLPIEQVGRDVLLAYRMNGTELSPPHGFPVRAIVPGWYGMASVKWLRRILVSPRPFAGYFQSFEYTHWTNHGGMPSLVPLGPGEVKSLIFRPSVDELLESGQIYRVYGAAWAGESEITAVSVSVDGGRSWNPAQLLDPPARYCWVRWEYQWKVPAATQSATLLSRATAQDGRTQPSEHAPEERNYSVHHVFQIPVRVE